MGLTYDNEGYWDLFVMKPLSEIRNLRLIIVSEFGLLISKYEIWRSWLSAWEIVEVKKKVPLGYVGTIPVTAVNCSCNAS